jgi:hypothetical protein
MTRIFIDPDSLTLPAHTDFDSNDNLSNLPRSRKARNRIAEASVVPAMLVMRSAQKDRFILEG